MDNKGADFFIASGAIFQIWLHLVLWIVLAATMAIISVINQNKGLKKNALGSYVALMVLAIINLVLPDVLWSLKVTNLLLFAISLISYIRTHREFLFDKKYKNRILDVITSISFWSLIVIYLFLMPRYWPMK